MTKNFLLFLRLTGEIREIFKGLGSSFVERVGTRDGWVFAGQRGLKESQFEKVCASFLKNSQQKGLSLHIFIGYCGCLPAK